MSLYNQARDLFNSRRILPSDHPDKWNSFGDWLMFYNLSDCGPLVEAIEKSFQFPHVNHYHQLIVAKHPILLSKLESQSTLPIKVSREII